MATIKLDEAWTYRGVVVGPGDAVEVTDELYDVLKRRGAFVETPEMAKVRQGEVALQTPALPNGDSTPKLPQDIIDRLKEEGYASPDEVLAASDDELLAIEGIGPKTLEKIREAYTPSEA